MSVTIKGYAEARANLYDYSVRIYRTLGEARQHAIYDEADIAVFNIIAPDATAASMFDNKVVPVYRWYRRNTFTNEYTYVGSNRNGDWYVSRDNAMAVAEEFFGDLRDTEEYMYYKEDGYVYPREAYPVKCPVHGLLLRSRKGDLCYRGNLRPDLDCWPKNYYIDRECKEKLVEGSIVITGYKDIGHCGFITAKMEQFEYPDNAAIDCWILETLSKGHMSRYMGHVKSTMKIPGVIEWKKGVCGNYTKVTLTPTSPGPYGNKVIMEMFLVKDDTEAGIAQNYYLSEADSSAAVEAREDISDYLVKGYQNFKTFEEFKKYFTDLNLPKLPRDYSDLNKDTVIPRIVDEAMSTYTIDAHITKGIRFYNIVTTYQSDWLNLLTQYSPDEIKEIHDIIAATNTAAKKKFGDLRIPLRD